MTDTPTMSSAKELDAMVKSLASISGDLLRSYERLAQRAEHVEQELCRTNAELEHRVAEVEAILQALPVGVAVRGEDGSVVRINGALMRILGRPPEELLGHPAQDVLPAPCAVGETFEYRRVDGTKRVLSSRTATITAEGGQRSGTVEVFDDRTEVSRLVARVHQMDKMAALGGMAAGIAHEIRNPMNAVKGFADLFRRSLEPGTKNHRWAAAISEGVAEVDAIITSILSFSQPEKLDVETLEPGQIVESALEAALQRTPGNRPPSCWRIERSSGAGTFRGDRIKLRQALRNLISNALEIQPEGGRIDVRAEILDGHVRFSVDDAGPGIPEGLAGRIADPFFTTRAEGTGLGLSLVHTVASLHGGSLEVLPTRSSLGGATIQFQVPVSPVR